MNAKQLIEAHVTPNTVLPKKKHAMRSIRITWDDGDTTETNINGTDDDVREYYVGRSFNVGDGAGGDLMKKAVKVEFLDEARKEKWDDRFEEECAACHDEIGRGEIEHYYSKETEGGEDIGVCTRCREDFESDMQTELDSDVPSPKQFSQLKQWVNDFSN